MAVETDSVAKSDPVSEQLAQGVLDKTAALYALHAIQPNAVQLQMLSSHVRVMAHRSLTGEVLPEVDASLFEDISPESLALAQQIVDLFGDLPPEEAWLLSVHIEVAKANE